MLQSIRDWYNKVPDKWSIMTRLSKNSVRMHENVRLSGEGGKGAAEGTFAQGQAFQFQQSLGQKIPLFGTALNFAQGNSKELSSIPGFPGGPKTAAPLPGLPTLPPLPPLPPLPALPTLPGLPGLPPLAHLNPSPPLPTLDFLHLGCPPPQAPAKSYP